MIRFSRARKTLQYALISVNRPTKRQTNHPLFDVPKAIYTLNVPLLSEHMDTLTRAQIIHEKAPPYSTF